MKRFAFSLPLRVTIPSLLLFLSSGLGFYSFITEVNVTYKRQENKVLEQANFYSEKTVGLLEFILRRVNIDNKSLDAAKLVIGETGEEPNLQLSAFLDENN
ncbi:MAG: hypothetical protein ACRC78_21535, partial [Planktothrix sp.]